MSATSTKEHLKFPTEREASLKEFDNSLSQPPMGDAPTLIVSIGSTENIDQPEEDKRSRVPRSPKKVMAKEEVEEKDAEKEAKNAEGEVE